MAVVVVTDVGTVTLREGAGWFTSAGGDLLVENEYEERIAQFASGRWHYAAIKDSAS